MIFSQNTPLFEHGQIFPSEFTIYLQYLLLIFGYVPKTRNIFPHFIKPLSGTFTKAGKSTALSITTSSITMVAGSMKGSSETVSFLHSSFQEVTGFLLSISQPPISFCIVNTCVLFQNEKTFIRHLQTHWQNLTYQYY